MASSEITDDHVASKRQKVEKLSEQVEQAKRELTLSETGRHNHVEMARLDAEESRLQAELSQLRENLKVSKADPSKDQTVQAIQGTAAEIDKQERAADASTKEK